MQVVHPMQKCPAEFVETFREVLEQSNWSGSYRIYICHAVEAVCAPYSNVKAKDMIDWIHEQLEQEYTFVSWLVKQKGFSREPSVSYINTCLKAWLEWLVSPEGHYVNE